MNEKLIDDYLEHALNDVPPERREEVRKDTKVRIMKKVIDVASEKRRLVNDDVIRDVLTQWPPYRPLKAIAAPAPKKQTGRSDLTKVVLSLAGLVLAFVLLDVAFLLLVPDASGVPKADVSAIILAVVVALVIAIVVIGVIFASMLMYNTRIKKVHGDRIDRVEKVLKDATSPVRVGALTIATLAWMAILYFFWREVAIPAFDTSGKLVFVFSDAFASFVPLILALSVAMIVVNALYLLVTPKWIVSLAETAVNAGVMLLFYLMIQAFPFNPLFGQEAKIGIYLVLCLVFLVLAVGVAKNLIQTLRFMSYASSGIVHHKRSHL